MVYHTENMQRHVINFHNVQPIYPLIVMRRQVEYSWLSKQNQMLTSHGFIYLFFKITRKMLVCALTKISVLYHAFSVSQNPLYNPQSQNPLKILISPQHFCRYPLIFMNFSIFSLCLGYSHHLLKARSFQLQAYGGQQCCYTLQYRTK